MNLSETYQRLNAPIAPSPALVEQTLAKTRRRRLPSLRRLAALAAAAAVLLATPALAAQTEPGYHLLYALSPAAAQFFQPVRLSCADNGVTMEVAAVRIQGDTAQVYITLSGESVDGACDLFDSYSFHLPFDQSGHCEFAGYDEETRTAVFLCTTRTLDGSPIPTGGKMTFSLDCFLTGKTEQTGVEIPLRLADHTGEAAAMSPDGESFSLTGGGGGWTWERIESTRVLVPGPALASPAEGLTVTAAGYVDGLFHVQLCQGDASRMDNHGRLYLTDGDGKSLQPLGTVSFASGAGAPDRRDYQEFVFDLPRESLAAYTLLGDLWTASARVDGDWRVTFPLLDTFSNMELADIAGGHSTGSFDPQDTLLTFASHLETETGRNIRWEDGFHYALPLKTDRLWEAEFQCADGGALRVWLQNVPYEDTSGLWQPYAWAWRE